MREVKNDGQPTPLNAPILKRRTACDGEFNTYAGERDDTALFVLYKKQEVRQDVYFRGTLHIWITMKK